MGYSSNNPCNDAERESKEREIDYSIFQSNFRRLIGKKKQKEIAAELNVSTTAISRALNGEQAPTLELVLKIANYFKCSIDSLLGISHQYTYNDFMNMLNYLYEQKCIDFPADEEEFSGRGFYITNNKRLKELISTYSSVVNALHGKDNGLTQTLINAFLMKEEKDGDIPIVQDQPDPKEPFELPFS